MGICHSSNAIDEYEKTLYKSLLVTPSAPTQQNLFSSAQLTIRIINIKKTWFKGDKIICVCPYTGEGCKELFSVTVYPLNTSKVTYVSSESVEEYVQQLVLSTCKLLSFNFEVSLEIEGNCLQFLEKPNDEALLEGLSNVLSLLPSIYRQDDD